MQNIIPLIIIIPLASAFLIPVIGRFWDQFAKILVPAALLILTVLSVMFLLAVNENPLTYEIGGWEPIQGIPIAIYFVIDGLSALLLVIISLIGFTASLYATSYIRKYTAQNNFFTLFCLMVTGMNGVVITGDLFNLFVFLEIAVISSYALVAFGTEKEELEASFKYQVLGGIASLLIVFGIGLVYWHTKTLNMADASSIIARSGDQKILLFTQLIFVAGFGLKSALIPFHAWLPDAHSSAPSPISAMLSGVFIKAIGIYSLFRIFVNVFTITYEIALVITVIGTLSMIIGGLVAYGQTDIKRLLAYSSISQMGYIAVSAGAGLMIITTGGNEMIARLCILGSLFHLVNHAVFKGLLFLNAGAIEFETGLRDMYKMGGLSQKMKITSGTSLIASLAISGLPPFNGFFSKIIIIIALVQAKFYVLATLAVIISIVTLAYFLKLQKNAFYSKSVIDDSLKNIREVPIPMSVSMIFLAVLCLAMSLLIIPEVRDGVLTPAVNTLLGGSDYTLTVFGK